MAAVTNATEILWNERRSGRLQNGTVREEFIHLQVPENTVIVGDLHGDLASLDRILHEIDHEAFLANRNNKLIFLGDYIDRGSGSVAVLYTICKLKEDHPDSVVLMRGNHEAPVEFPFNSHDLPQRISEFFGGAQSADIYRSVLSFFRQMAAIVTIEKRLLLSHGGLPVHARPLGEIHLRSDRGSLEEILWSDPRPVAGAEWEASRRHYGKHFGATVTEKWLGITMTRVLVRGHEPCMGYRIDHGGTVMTLFSCKEAYPRFEAGYISIRDKDLRLIKNATDLARHVRIVSGRA